MNRRKFLKALGLSIGTAAISADLIEALAAPDLPPPLARPALDRDPVTQALNRITFGPRPGQVDAVKKMGLQTYLEQQLAPQNINDDASEKRLGDYITLDMTPDEMYTLGRNDADIIGELDSATIMRSVYSERQLFEVMVNFWSDHFSIWHLKESCKVLKTPDDRDVIRTHALGKFRDLLGASAKSPAMLIYLDNAKSVKQHPNENYARELMELHTITIGNYTEDDVKEVARCFTGWSVQGVNGAKPGQFVYYPQIHDDGAKTVLGHTIPAGGGMQDGETVLDIFAAHPGTAHHVCSKLCRRFIADDPPETVVQSAAKTFLSSGGDIPSVLRVIFSSAEFLNAPPKFKRPYEYLISLYRAFDAQLDPFSSFGDLTQPPEKANVGAAPMALLKMMGHLPFDHITPDGYTDYASLWISNMLLRWNVPILLVHGYLPGSAIELTALARGQNVELKPRPVLDFFAQHLLGRALTRAELDSIWSFATKNGEPDLTTNAGRLLMRSAIALVAASPAFQYR